LDANKTFSKKIKDRPKFYCEELKVKIMEESFDADYKEDLS